MYRIGTVLIVGMSLLFVLIIIITFMFNTSLEGADNQNISKNLITKIKEPVKYNSIKPMLDLKKAENEPLKPNEEEKQFPKKEIKKEEIKKVDKHLNRKTKNINILCLGIADGSLEMISIYSINKENKKSAGIFLPTRTSLKVNGEVLTLKEIFHKYGIVNLKKILGQSLEVNIPYHMVADKKGLVEFSKLIGPIYVENEYVDIPNLFVKPVSSKDDEILQALADELIQPKMIKELPALIKIFINNVESDIGVKGLWELYKVFRDLNHSELGKKVLWGEKVKMGNKEYWFVDPYDWHNVIYEMTF